METGAGVTETFRAGLERLLRSDILRNSEGLKNLLAYLGEKSLNAPGEELKEYTVGIEACGKPPAYDPQRDASVRVQMGRLRQRLEDYYRGEGAADPVLVEVPKGRFALLFHLRDSEAGRQLRKARQAGLKQGAARAIRSPALWLAVLTIALALSLTWAVALQRRIADWETRFGISRQENALREFSTFWGPFFAPTTPTLIVFGSPEFPAGAKQPRYDYAAMGDAIAVQRLTAFFGSAGVPLRAQPAHLASWESAAEGNLILIGAWRMNPMLRRLPVRQDFELGPDEIVHNRNPQPGEPLAYDTPSHDDVMTYAVVATYPGLKAGREILVILTHNPAGSAGAVDFLTDRRSLASLKDRLHLGASGPRRHFQMLLKVWVDKGAAVKTAYVTHHIEP
jgi:hypothetical protein